MRPSRFNVLSIVQLLQNIDDYNHVLMLEPYLYCNYTLETYKKWCTDRLFSRWPEQFPDLIRVLNYERDPFFMPGSSRNERRFYNFLLHYGKKKENKRPQKKVIFYLYTF